MLRPENVPIYEEMKQMLDTKGKCILITHPGRGKSYITEEYLIDTQPKNVICVCPTTVICKQWKDDHYAVPMNICTYSAFSKYDATQIGQPDIVIIDEAHHMGARVWGRNLIYVVENLVPKGTKVIALTADATRWSDGKINVADTWFDGCTVTGPSIPESMDQGFINSFTYVISLYKPKWLVDKLIANKKNATSAQLKSAKELAGKMQYLPENVLHVSKSLQIYAPKANQKGIVFCSKIEDIPDAMDTLKRAYPNHPQYVIHHKRGKKNNNTNLNSFNTADNAFLFSVNMAIEGLHTKGVNMVIMFRKTESPNLYTQMIGRLVDPDITDAFLHDIVGNNKSIENVLQRAESTATEINRIILTTQNGAANKPKQIIVNDLAAPATAIIKKIQAILSDNELTDDEKDFIRKNCQTMPTKDIATTLNVPVNKVKQFIKIEGLSTKPAPPWTSLREKALIDMVSKGKTDDYIAIVLGINNNDVLQKKAELMQKGDI